MTTCKIYKIFLWVCIFQLICGCKSQTQIDFDKQLSNLSVDSIYKTIEEKNKLNELKTNFLNIWMDRSNCYIQDYLTDPKYPNRDLKKILDVKILNVFHTINYDTLVFAVVYYAAWVNNDNTQNGGLSQGNLMKVTIDNAHKWHFDCRMNNFGYYSLGKNFSETELNLKRMIIGSGYLDSNGKANPNYIKNLFSKEVTFPKENKKERPEPR